MNMMLKDRRGKGEDRMIRFPHFSPESMVSRGDKRHTILEGQVQKRSSGSIEGEYDNAIII